MKILYIAHERRAVEMAAQALRGIAPDVRLAWAQSPAAAVSWFRDNLDVRAAIVDTAIGSSACGTFLEQVRAVGVALPIAVIAPADLEQLSAAVKAIRAEGQAKHDAALARSTKMCTMLQEQLLQLEVALRTAREEHAAQVAATEQLSRREAELSAAVEEAVTARTTVERRLADAEAARQHAVQHAAHELVAADERYAALENRLGREAAARAALDERLAEAESSRKDADQKHAAELTAFSVRVDEREAHHQTSLARTTRICTALQDRLLELETAIHAADARHAADTAANEQLALRERDLGAAVAEAIAARTSLEQRLAVTQTAYQRATRDLELATRRCVDLEQQLSRQTTTQSILEQRLAAAQAARHDADEQHATEVASLTTRLAGIQAQRDEDASQKAALEQQLRDSAVVLEETRRDWASEVRALTEQWGRRETEARAALAEAIAARTAVEQKLAGTERLHEELDQRAADEKRAAAERHSALQHALSDESSARTALAERLAAVEAASRDAARQHATELSSLTTRLAAVQEEHHAATLLVRQRETELAASLAEANAGRAAIENKLSEAEAAHRRGQARAAADLSEAAGRYAALEEQVQSSSRDIARLQREADSLRRQLDATRTHAAAYRRHAALVPQLQLQLEASKKENRRQFERAPYGAFECTRDGAVTRVSHSLARVLGYRSSAELHGEDFVATVFETAADLQWLLERAQQTGKAESVETTFKTRDLRRLFVRLHALTRDGALVVTVEDLTTQRAIEQRLREAERLEAVGRVASEVAVTCDTLLRDVSHGGGQWLAGFESDTRLRQQGELLLGDVRRAAGFLRQFVDYGHKQISNVEPVSLQRVFRDLAPVLKRVLGDDITLVLPKNSDPFEIDVDAERVERILVNVVNYARERMPHGGRVKVHLATTVVDRQFLANHPKVRPGAHVVVTIREVHGPVWPPLPIKLPRARAMDGDVPRPASEKPGMDLGHLVALISDLGGHLWMSAEPAGNMTLQIHLPKRTQDHVKSSPMAASRPNRGRQLARWFRH